MKKNEALKDLKVAYIGGGSRGWAWGFMKDLAMDPDMEGLMRLYDIDKEAAELNKIIGDKISAHPKALSKWRYEVSDSLEDALQDVDFVVISILPGTFDEMDSDVHAPEKYNIWQSVGDTAGPGGLVRSLRTVPMFVEIAEAIRAYSPEAWVINYTNPMAICMRTLYHVHPEIKAFGCCHEVFGTQKLLAAMVEEMLGEKDVKRQDIDVNVLGVNHFTWLDKASYKNIDLFPLYREFSDKYYESGYTKGKADNWINNSFDCSHRVKFDLFRRFGLIAAAGDRHLAEFMPNWYLKDPETVKAWGFGLTTVDYRKEDLKERIAKRDRLVSGKEEIKLEGSGEEGHLLMKAVLGMGNLVSNVNIPNVGQIPNLPEGCIVETNALFRQDSIYPVSAGEIPDKVLTQVMPHALNQKLILEAALDCDFDKALVAFMNEPLVNLQPEDAETLLTEMIRNTKKYLPEGWQDL